MSTTGENVDSRDTSVMEDGAPTEPRGPRARARNDAAKASGATRANDATATVALGVATDITVTTRAGRARDVEEPEELPQGVRIGRYLIVDRLGVGGMGVVYRAYDPELDRRLALKLVHVDANADAADADDARARLQREAQALARLSSPHVVSIYDVGVTDSGDVYIAMECIEGETLKDYARQRPWHEIAEAYRQAALGLHACHERGLVHRDFKPANVLVDASGRAVLLDFGLARTIAGAPETARAASDPGDIEISGVSSTGSGSYTARWLDTPLTQAGSIAGTPRYMAPEQVSGEDIGPAADQFSFCVALFEALYRQRPFEGRTLNEVMENAVAGRVTAPEDTRGAPGWLRAALVRGLAAEPEARWPSMQALAGALAADPRRRRRRLAAAAAVAMVVTVAGASSINAWATTRAQRCTGADQRVATVWNPERRQAIAAAFAAIERPFATGTWLRAERALDDYAMAWRAAHTDACAAHSIRGEQTAETMTLRMACLERARRALDATVRVFTAADLELAQKAVELTSNLPDLEPCADTDALSAGTQPPAAKHKAAVDGAEEHLAQANALMRAGRYQASADELAAARSALGDIDYGPTRVGLAMGEAEVLRELGRYDESEAAFRRVILEAGKHRDHEALSRAATGLVFLLGARMRRPEDALSHREWAEGLAAGDPEREAQVANDIGNVLRAKGDYEAAEDALRRALAGFEAALGPDDHNTASARMNLGIVLIRRGDLGAAEQELRAALVGMEKALGVNHPDVARARTNLGVVLSRAGRYDDAEQVYRQAIRGIEASLGPDDLLAGNAHVNLGIVLNDRGDHAGAEAEYRRALAIFQEKLGPGHTRTAIARMNLGNALEGQKRYAEAEEVFREVLDSVVAMHGPDNEDVAWGNLNLGGVLRLRGDYDGAQAAFLRALELFEAKLGAGHEMVGATRVGLGQTMADAGRLAEAERTLREALAELEKALGVEHPKVAGAKAALGNLLYLRGRHDEAVQLLERAIDVYERVGIGASALATARFDLSRALWEQRSHRDRALDVSRAALAELEAGTKNEATTSLRESIVTWLAAHDAGP